MDEEVQKQTCSGTVGLLARTTSGGCIMRTVLPVALRFPSPYGQDVLMEKGL